jgi:hypothetical protein
MLIVGIYVVSSIYGTMPAMATTAVANESISVDYGNWTQVDNSYGEHYYDNESVYNSNGQVLVEGTDYEWSPSNQSVKFYNTTDTSDGATGSIDYAFDHKPDTARNAVGTIGQGFVLGAVAVIVLVASLILGLIGGLGGGGRGRRR